MQSRLPGFGLPLNYVPSKGDPDYVDELFPNALNPQDIDGGKYGKAAMKMTTLREFSMLQFMNSVTDKPEWHLKVPPEPNAVLVSVLNFAGIQVYDDGITQKWKDEACTVKPKENEKVEEEDEGDESDKDDTSDVDNENEDPTKPKEDEKVGEKDDGDESDEDDEESDDEDDEERCRMTPKLVDWCIDELRCKAKLVSASPINPPPIKVYNGDVVKSDTAVSSDLKVALQEAVKKFEAAIPARMKDWHPGSDEQVWDLVHPSLYPLVYGQTRILLDGETSTLEDCIERSGAGAIVPIPPPDQRFDPPSQQGYVTGSYPPYSARFQWLPCEVDISGNCARVISCINNLHPKKEKALYGLVEKLIEASIPLWNATLAPLKEAGFSHEHRISWSAEEYDPDPESWPKTDGPQQEPDEDEDDYDARREEWIEETRKLLLPEPEGPFRPLLQPPPFDLKTTYGHRGLQVIVKLANIELTPEKPKYAGGAWHVEGQLNEHIVSTALYYYSCENITTSKLSFRHQCDPQEPEDAGWSYSQDDKGWLWEIFGCEQGGSGIQYMGDIETREGRLLTFPNILQHRVDPFELADPTKPGHRKIVALFLVDPNIKIISTAHVPCQQQEWWWESIMDSDVKNLTGLGKAAPAVSDIPIELQGHVLRGVDFPFNMEDAEKLRSELMKERKQFVISHGKAFQKSSFSLCEH